jgi:cysteinyl-tRNA synthetase
MRFLEFRGFNIFFVRNYTDVDDKIINRAKEEKCSSIEISEKYTKAYDEDMASLGIRPPNVSPKVTTHIQEIISLIEKLIEKKAAYVAEDGEVFYSVKSFKEYGKLSGKKVDDLLVGVRIAADEKKRDPLDFSLWKPRKNADEPAWDSPWCKGRPGWHIECSAMAMKYLGETFDIHGGGIDLMHPHHENEIAQSEAVTEKPFAKFWLHNNLVSIENEKMSKSLGNIFLNRDFIAKYTAETLKFLLLSNHYRSPIDFSASHIRDCQAALQRYYRTADKCEAISIVNPTPSAKPTEEEENLFKFAQSFQPTWIESMEDDLNTAKVVGTIFEYVRAINAYMEKKNFKPNSFSIKIATEFLSNMKVLASVLNIFGEKGEAYLSTLRKSVIKEKGITIDYIEKKILDRNDARKNKDFATADAIRKELLEQSIELQDSNAGTIWEVKL